MADIFVSYTRADQGFVRLLVGLLEAQGWSVWWDTRISGGERWDEVIEREIRAARCVVVVWTPQSIGSEWVHLEAHYGRSRGILVPILVGCDKPPFAFSLIQACNLSGWDGMSETAAAQQFLAAVAQRLGAPSVELTQPSAATGAVPIRGRYPDAKIEELRAAAKGMRSLMWSTGFPDASARIQAFQFVAEDFTSEPRLALLLEKIDACASRLNIMANFHPVGEGSPDPKLRQELMNEGHEAVDELLRLTGW